MKIKTYSARGFFLSISLIAILAASTANAQINAYVPAALTGIGPLSAKSGTGGNTLTVPLTYTAGTYSTPMVVLTYWAPVGGRLTVQYWNVQGGPSIPITIDSTSVIGTYRLDEFYFSDTGGSTYYARDGSISRSIYTSSGLPTRHSFDLSQLDFTVVAPAVPLTPSIASQPSSVRVTAGQTSTFSVLVSDSSAPSFQWRKNGTNIVGATTTVYSIAKTLAADAGQYDVIVTNSAGSTISSSAALTVDSGRLKNLSVRIVIPDNGLLIAGFVVDTPKAVLIRGIGRSLSQFGIPASSTVSDPRLEVYNSAGTRILTNDDYDPVDIAAMAKVGAFPLNSSKDSAIVTTLNTGAYSVQLKPADGKGGDCLIEVYDFEVTN